MTRTAVWSGMIGVSAVIWLAAHAVPFDAAAQASVSTSSPPAYGFAQTGLASFYAGRGRTASGGKANPNHMTAAHRKLPFGSRVRVTHLKSGREIVVTINDRGPFRKGRIIDLSYAAAKALGITRQGLARVRIVRID